MRNKINEGQHVYIAPGEYISRAADAMEIIEEEEHGCAYEYAGNGDWRVLTDGGYDYLVPEAALRPDTPEMRLALLVFGKDDIIEMPAPPISIKPNEDRGGRCATPIEQALLTLILSPHTRATLAIVDPQGLRQADKAMMDSGWIVGTEWPEDRLSTRQQCLQSLGCRLHLVNTYMAMWQEVKSRAAAHPNHKALTETLGVTDQIIREFARLAGDRCSENKLALTMVGLDIGFTEVELFQATEAAEMGGAN